MSRRRAALILLPVVVMLCRPTAAPAAPDRGEIYEFTDDGAWSWFSDERAFCADGRVCAGCVTRDGDVRVASLDLWTGSVFLCNLASDFEPDDHDYPAFYETSDGRYTAFFEKHAVFDFTVQYRTTEIPHDISSWLPRVATGVNTFGSGGATYANPYTCPGDTDRIFLFWRGGNWKPNWSIGTYDPETVSWTWTGASTLISTPSGRPYVKYSQAPDGRIGFAFTDGHPADTKSSIHYASIGLDEYGAEAFLRADGSLIKTMIEGPLEVDEADVVFDRLADPEMTGDNAWVWDIAFDESGHPCVVYATFPSRAQHQYHWARFDGSSWLDVTLVWDAGGSCADTTIARAQYYYSGGIALDHASPNIVYVSCRNEEGGWDLDQLATPDWGGRWTRTRIATEATEDNVRPVVPLDRPADTEMVLWMSGRYDFYRNYVKDLKEYYYDTRILLWTCVSPTSVEEAGAPVVSRELLLFPNHPNPFASSTEIRYANAAEERVRLRVHDVSGRVVRTIVDGRRGPGEHVESWDGRDDRGRAVASGVYFLKLEGSGRSETRRIVLVK
jgi:hypothetical protein